MVASACFARSLASPAPAAVNAPIPSNGLSRVTAIPAPKEPIVSPSLRPNISSEPGSAPNILSPTSPTAFTPERKTSDPTMSSGAVTPRAALSANPTAPPGIPLKNSSNWSATVTLSSGGFSTGVTGALALSRNAVNSS